MPEENEKRVIHGQRVPAPSNSLGGKVTYRDKDGSIHTEEQIRHCNRCGGQEDDNNYNLCVAAQCGKTLHIQCAYIYDGQTYCKDHVLKLIRNTSKNDTKVLIAIDNKVRWSRRIAKLCVLTKKEIETSKERLVQNGYLQKSKILWLFNSLELSEDGVEFLPLCYQVYKRMNSMKQFIDVLKQHLQKKGRTPRSIDYSEDAGHEEEKL